MTIIQLKKFLLDHIHKAVETPAASCSDYTLRQMWEFYNDFCDRQIKNNRINYKAIITESMKSKVLQDFSGGTKE